MTARPTPDLALADPLLSRALNDCRRIFVRGFELMASIGFYESELAHKQRIRIAVDVFVPIAATTPLADDPAEIIDYDFIRREITALVASRHFNLQETLLDRIVATCLAHPNVRAVRASTEKPDIYPGDMTAGIEVFRFNDDPTYMAASLSAPQSAPLPNLPATDPSP